MYLFELEFSLGICSILLLFNLSMCLYLGFPGDSVVKNLPANAGDVVSNLDQEDPLEKEMATHSSILAWKSRGQKNLAAKVEGSQKSQM